MSPLVTTLQNGVRLVLTHVPHARSVAVSVYMAAGSRYEQPHEAGLSHFVEHLCFKGTERRPRPQDISIEIDAIGGTINAATDREYTVYYAKVTEEHAARAVDILADTLMNSLFVESEIERERDVILEELAAVEDSPDEQSSILLDSLVWPGQPQGRDIGGTPATVSAITPARLIEYYRTQYVANAAVVSIAGSLPEADAERLATEAFGVWRQGEPASWIPALEEPRGERAQTLAKQTEQAHLSLGGRGLSYHDPDRYALDVLSVILGEGMSSRLFLRLREELALCYDIHSFSSHLRDTGQFGVYVGVDPERAERAVAEVLSELRKARQPVSEEELARAQGLLRARTLLRMEDTRSVSGWYGSQEILDLPRLTPEETIARVEAVTIQDISRVAERVLTDANLHLAAVGPLEGVDLLGPAPCLDA